MQNRSPLIVLVLSLFSFGIYPMIWFYSTANEMKSKGANVANPLLYIIPVLAILGLSIVMMAMGVFTAASFGPRNYGGRPDDAILASMAVFFIIFAIVAIGAAVMQIYFMWSYSGGVEKITSGKLSQVVTFILLFLLGVIGMMIIQDAFNKAGDLESLDDPFGEKA